jgi:regulator of protease activity HflC (stomatin/prohibitin superfamily)
MNEQKIQFILWAAIGVGAVLFALRGLWARRKKNSAKPYLITAAALAVAAMFVVPAVGVVPAGYRGVVYEWSGGVNPAERGEGFTLLIPWAQHMNSISVQTQKVYSDKVFSQSLDLQEITVVASINYHVKPELAAELYQGVGTSYPNTVIQPALFQRTKAAIGQIIAEDFARNREKLAATVQSQLAAQLSSYGIVVEFVNIEDAIFDPAFVKAVKAKIIASQKAQEEQNLVAAKRAIKAQTIIGAEAEAKKISIEASAQARANVKLASSLSPDLLKWRWMLEWNGQLPTTLVDGEGSNLLLGVNP